MTSIVKVTPLCGALDSSPPCYLLNLDGTRILLDCGWDELFRPETLELLAPVAPLVDVALISHNDIAHVGGLPYARKQLGLNCPVYATTPVKTLGMLQVLDAWKARDSQEDFDIFDQTDIQDSFGDIVAVKYLQTISIQGTGIEIMPFRAGHTLGGAVWRIMFDEQAVVYAVDYNHKRERHLSGTILETLSRPFALVTSSSTALYQPAKRKDRDHELVELMQSTLRQDGTVVVLADTAGRALELLLLIHQLRKVSQLGMYRFLFASAFAQDILKYAQTLVEFMSTDIMKFDASGSNPFYLPELELCPSIDHVRKFHGPKIVLAGLNSLEAGLSRELFLEFADDPRNLMLFTVKPVDGSLGDYLLKNVRSPGHRLTLDIKRRVRLEGEELARHQAAQRQKQAAVRAQLEQQAQERLRENDIDEDSDDEQQDMDAAADGAPAVKRVTRQQSVGVVARQRHAGAQAVFRWSQPKPHPDFDDYGEPFDEESLRLLRPGIGEPTDSRFAPVVQQKPADDVESTEPSIEEQLDLLIKPPTKAVVETYPMTVSCQVRYIDFEGLSDGDSVQHILQRVRPRHLVAVRGAADATEHLLTTCASSSEMDNLEKAFMPAKGDTVDISAEKNIFQAQLTDALVSSLLFRECNGYKLAWVDGEVSVDNGGSDGVNLPILKQPGSAVEHNSVFVGDFRPTEFKSLLESKGFQTYFSGGKLICNERVAVARDTTGVFLEGPLCRDYYTVRDLLYKQFAVV